MNKEYPMKIGSLNKLYNGRISQKQNSLSRPGLVEN